MAEMAARLAARACGTARWAPSGHEVVRRVGAGATTPQGAPGATAVYAVGLGDAALDAVGAVQAVRARAGAGAAGSAGAAVAELEWEGVVDSHADEMYHSRFRQARGLKVLHAPFACRVLELNAALAADPDGPQLVDTELPHGGWVVRVEAREADVAAAEAAGRLLSGEAYFAAQEAARAAADREDRKRPQDGGAVGQTWCNTRAVMEGARAPGTFGPGFEGER